MLAECASCGTRYAPDLSACPQCGSEERADEMAKIVKGVGPTFPEDRAAADAGGQVQPVPADAPAQDDVSAELEQVREELEHVEAEVAPAPAAAPVPPRVPPRRTAPPGASGG